MISALLFGFYNPTLQSQRHKYKSVLSCHRVSSFFFEPNMTFLYTVHQVRPRPRNHLGGGLCLVPLFDLGALPV